MTIVNVNGVDTETGCYVDGHWGQYGPDHLADRAEEFGWEPRMVNVDGFDKPVADDPRVWRAIADSLATLGHRDRAGEIWEFHTESADAIEQWLNDHTPDGFVWHWHDGEFFLSPICDDDENCTDETCAHWSFG